MNRKKYLEALQTLLQLSELLCLAYKAYLDAMHKMRRRWWVRPVNLSRDLLGFHETGTKQLMLSDKEHFFMATKMYPANFQCLLELLREKLKRNSPREAIAPDLRLSITLLYLAQDCDVKMLAWTHKIGISTVRKIIYETCEAIWSLHTVYLAPPNLIDWVRNAEVFYIKTGMPNCLGAIDGKHIAIICPRRSASLYFNYKRHFSVVLMAACDANYCFTYVDVGGLGSQSDGGVFLRSAFGRQILNQSLQVPADRPLPGTSGIFPHYFVADSAFPLKANIMRPYPGRHLPADKQNFNKVMSRARVRIENTFGILSSRWRVLRSPIHAKPDNVDKIVLASVVLHNFLMLKKDTSYFNNEDPDRFGDGDVLRLARLMPSNRSTLRAFQLRDVLKDYLYQEGHM